MWKPKSSIYQLGVSALMAGLVLTYPSSIDLAGADAPSSLSKQPVKAHPVINARNLPLNVSLHHYNHVHNKKNTTPTSVLQLSDPILRPAVKTLVLDKQEEASSTSKSPAAQSSSDSNNVQPTQTSNDSADHQTNDKVSASSSNDNQTSTVSTKEADNTPKQTTTTATAQKESQATPKQEQPKQEQPKETQPKQQPKATPSTTTTADHSTNVIAIAESLIGTPYKWGGTTPSGFDCSGFVDYVFAKAGVNLPRSANAMWYGAGTKVSSPQVGDLIFFTHTYNTSSTATHVGIYIGGGRFIHAESNGVRISSLSGEGGYWQQHYLGVKSVQ